jgi:hypothetical protein
VQHVGGDLRLDGIHIIHEGRRADAASEEDERGDEEDD